MIGPERQARPCPRLAHIPCGRGGGPRHSPPAPPPSLPRRRCNDTGDEAGASDSERSSTSTRGRGARRGRWSYPRGPALVVASTVPGRGGAGRDTTASCPLCSPPVGASVRHRGGRNLERPGREGWRPTFCPAIAALGQEGVLALSWIACDLALSRARDSTVQEGGGDIVVDCL